MTYVRNFVGIPQWFEFSGFWILLELTFFLNFVSWGRVYIEWCQLYTQQDGYKNNSLLLLKYMCMYYIA